MLDATDPEQVALVVAAHDLVGRYCDAVLRADVAAFGDAWAVDAEWVIPGREPVVGRAAIVELYSSLVTPIRRTVQEVLSGTVEPTSASTARARWQVRELQWRTDGTTRELLGVYRDAIALDAEGVARFTSRAFEVLYAGEATLPGRLREP